MILEKYTTFNELINYINYNLDIKISYGGNEHHRGIKLVDRGLPISINEHEFNYMHDFIVGNNLQNGYELATGTGISTLSAGIAFKKTNGKLITLDNYIEEESQIIQVNPTLDKTNINSLAYKLVIDMINHFNLTDTVSVHIGNSPEKTIEIFEEIDCKLDYVFFDCPKSDLDFHRDLMSIIKYLNTDKFLIFVHDTHTFTQKSFNLVKEVLGIEMKLIFEYYVGTSNYSNRKYPMAIITNINV